MMIWRAPGKLVLAGEFAVLDGSPAIALAVDRGVECIVEDLPGGNSPMIEAPGDLRFVQAALKAVSAPPARYRFRDWNPVNLPGKAGFGSSAAATVAAVLAGGSEARLALDIHKAVQGGGSGVDVAASVAGGMIRFQEGTWTDLPPILPLVAWSGQGADTMGRVRAYLSWKDRSAFVHAMADLVDRFIRDPLATTWEMRRLLQGMAISASFLYETPALQEIARLAEDLGGAARPSGAGGGDCAIVFLPDPERRALFAADCLARGFPIIPVQPAAPAGLVHSGVQEAH